MHQRTACRSISRAKVFEGSQTGRHGCAAVPCLTASSSMKLCPYCSGKIGDAAIVCQHCGRDWNTPVSDAAPVQPVQPPSADVTPWLQPPSTLFPRSWRVWACRVVIILVLLYVGTCAVALQRIH
jgi:hypothetical protein